MDFEWVAIAFGDVAWISLAFLLGFLASQINLPPLVGFLITGFVLNYIGIAGGEMLQKLADLGITLLLFTVGLKLDIKSLSRPQVWGTTLLHMSLITSLFGVFIFGLSLLGLPLLTDLNLQQSLLVAFALSFSSTVFVVKVLEEKGEMNARHGRIAIGILIMQDLAAVIFLATTSGKLPTIWALGLILLIPVTYLLKQILERAGHGELLILYGFVLALGGAEVFELVGVKDDLGALFIGVLISTHPKAKELASNMMGFKDIFLVGFFLTIGLAGELSILSIIMGIALVPLIFIKSALFYKILTGFKLRARTALLATLNLTNYSEFGLIVIAIGVSLGWLDSQWLIVMAIALSVSFMVAAPFNSADNQIYRRHINFWRSFQTDERLSDDLAIDTNDAKVAVFGMGRVGAGAYKRLCDAKNNSVIGIDFDQKLINHHAAQGRNVAVGNPNDPDFWEKIEHNCAFDLILLAMPNLQANLSTLNQLKSMNYPAKIAAVVRYPDEEELFRDQGVMEVFNIYTEAGTGFADNVLKTLEENQ